MSTETENRQAPRIVVAVKGLLVYRRRALILRRSATDRYSGMWEFPGGRFEFGEQLEGALCREIKEETGLDATVQKLLYASSLVTGPQRQIVVLDYLCQAAGESFVLSSEHDDGMWATRTQMEAMLDSQIVENLRKFDVFSRVELD